MASYHLEKNPTGIEADLNIRTAFFFFNSLVCFFALQFGGKRGCKRTNEVLFWFRHFVKTCVNMCDVIVQILIPSVITSASCVIFIHSLTSFMDWKTGSWLIGHKIT